MSLPALPARFNIEGELLLYEELTSAQRLAIISAAETIATGPLSMVPTLRKGYSLACVITPTDHGEPYMYLFIPWPEIGVEDIMALQDSIPAGDNLNWYAIANSAYQLR